MHSLLTASEKPKSTSHIPSLDGVRGLAILMVIVSHAFASNYASAGMLWKALGTLLGYGLFGVDLFFVLSGFLITGILVDSLSDDGFFRKFYARRVLRIFPLYYGVLLILFVLTPVLHLHWNGMEWLMLADLQNFRPSEIVNYSPGAGVGLNHFWSLAVEEQFYLVWPAIVFLVHDRRKLMVVTLAVSLFALLLRVVLVGTGVGTIPIHVTTLTRADSLLVGGALALLYRSWYWDRVQRWAGYGFAASAGIIVVSVLVLPAELGSPPVFSLAIRLWLDGLRYTVLALGSACLIAWALRPVSGCTWVFERGWLRFLGKYSYGIYVLHMVPLALLLTAQRAAILRITHSRVLAVAGAGISSLAMTVLAAYACFHLYERPFLRYKRYFSYVPKRKAEVPILTMPVGHLAGDLVNSESFTSEVSFR